jgi:hypothetical protein
MSKYQFRQWMFNTRMFRVQMLQGMCGVVRSLRVTLFGASRRRLTLSGSPKDPHALDGATKERSILLGTEPEGG